MIDTRDLAGHSRPAAERSRPSRASTSASSAGEIFGFLGPNGAGKTTTLRMLATLIRPTAGEATVAGVDLLREPQLVRQRIGYVPQGGSTDPAETGRGELVIQGRLYGMTRAEREGARRRGARGAGPRGRRGSRDRHVLGRACAAGSTSALGHRPPPAGALPRRADDRPRPAGSGPDVGRDPQPARARGRPSS